MAESGQVIRKESFFGEEVEVVYRPACRPQGCADAEAERYFDSGYIGFCPPLNTRTYIAEQGILCDQDQPVQLRDGTTIYADIYRPDTLEKIPVILSWSYFGKRPGDGLEGEWNVPGVPPGTLSRLMKFESVDPAYWCRMGYAVANVDPRGVGHSEGDICFHGSRDARDGYDFIEWIAARPWCNGRVGMAGNSGVAVPQWAIAAQQPPHLACLAPWEGTTDLFNEALYDGGVPGLKFHSFLTQILTGCGLVEDIGAMARKYPFFNAYWRDKVPDFSRIDIPCYATASWSHFHLKGAFDGFNRIASERKWMRAHREFEWPDFYTPANIEDLRRFFDRYLKGIRNGWELTPRVRIEVMDAFDCDLQTNRAENEFPLSRTEYRKLFLDARDMTLSPDPVETEASAIYDPESGLATFDIAFDESTEITGYMTLHLWVETKDHDEMDLFITVQKLSSSDEWLPTNVLGQPHPGAWGKIRASRRALDPDRSGQNRPILLNQGERKLAPGEIVPVEIEIWPTSRIWHPGQRLRLQVAGRYIREKWFEPLSWETDNSGKHVIHTGGRYASCLKIPVIPPKHRDGDVIYR
ncbi:MAG: CocE/NonD family hydrolase [Mesorhizobium sp.]|nr:MAG: CocE/NonD family hydrolase [Mesorhizobium sp.]